MTIHTTFVKWALCLGVLSIGASMSAIAQTASVDVRIGVRPPMARIERIPPARHGYLWAPGYWAWNGRGHVWVDEHWEHERAGYRFVEARWALVGSEWVFYPGYWDPMQAPVVMVQPMQQVVVQQPNQAVYVEQPQSNQPSAQWDPNFWYYCNNPAGYYPYVKDCSSDWQQVTPTPP